LVDKFPAAPIAFVETDREQNKVAIVEVARCKHALADFWPLRAKHIVDNDHAMRRAAFNCKLNVMLDRVQVMAAINMKEPHRADALSDIVGRYIARHTFIDAYVIFRDAKLAKIVLERFQIAGPGIVCIVFLHVEDVDGVGNFVSTGQNDK